MFHISSVHTDSPPVTQANICLGWCFPRCAVTILSIRCSWWDDIGPPFGCGWISRHRLGVVLYADVGVLLINREGNRMWQGEGEWEARNRANRSSLLTAAGLAGADGEREREREAHRCDIDPMGLVLPVLICERKMSMFELLMKAPSCPRLLGHYQKKSEFLVPLYINVRSCVTLPVISTSDSPLSIGWCLYSRHTKHNITFSI